jgi:MYXO-CTERM domain-containing protein
MGWERSAVGATVLIATAAFDGSAFALQVEKPETAVSAPSYVALSAGATMPDLACNDGGCLAIWRDTRSGADSSAIWALRLGPDGTPRDAAAFLLRSQTQVGVVAAVATDGSRFVVAWWDANNLLTTVVAPDGSTSTSVVQGAGVPFLTDVAIAFGQDQYLVAVTQSAGSFVGVSVVRLDRDGQALDPQLIPVDQSAGVSSKPAVVWTGSQYLLVWNDSTNPSSALAQGTRVLPDGAVRDPGGFTVATLASSTSHPRLAWGGDVVMMVAGKIFTGSGDGLDSMTLDADGKNPQRFTLPVTTMINPPTDPGVAWNGSAFVVTWGPSGTAGLVATRVRPDRSLVDTSPLMVVNPARGVASPRIASAAGSAQVIYVGNDGPIYGVTLAANGTVSNQNPPALVDAAAAQQLVTVGRGDGQLLVVWSDEGPGMMVPQTFTPVASLQVARVADDGSPLDPTSIRIADLRSNEPRYVAVAHAPGVYLIAWYDDVDLGGDTIRAVRMSDAGLVLDSSPLVLASFIFPPTQVSAAFDGQTFVVSSFRVTSGMESQGPVQSQRVGVTGGRVGGLFNIGPTDVSTTPNTLLAASNGCIAAWGQPDSLRIAFVGQGGVVGPARVAIPSFVSNDRPTLIPVGPRLLLWQFSQGVIVDASDPFAISGPTYRLSSFIGTPTWDGMAFTAATFAFGSAHGLSGVALNVMGPDGTLATPTVLTDTRLQVANPTSIGLGGGRSLVAYSRLIPDSAFGNFQVRYQIVKNDVVPTADGGVGADGGSDAMSVADGGAGDGTSHANSDGDGPLVPDGGSDGDASSPSQGGPDARDAADERGADAPPPHDASLPPEIADGSAPDRADASLERPPGGSGCSCEVGRNDSAGWSWIGVLALALVRARRRSSRS